MKNLNTACLILIFGSLISIILGCKKQDSFLDAKPNQALAIPSSLSDLQALLNDEDVFNRNYPAVGEAGTDDIYMEPSIWISDLPRDQNAYVWAKQIYSPTESVNDWNSAYKIVYYANTVLDALPKVSNANNPQVQVSQVKGSALFFRAIAFYNLVQIYAMPYDSTTASKYLGIPMPLVPDLNAKVSRSTEADCYNQIITDLNSAVLLLADIPTRKTAPSKASAYALLSRIYLVMGKFTQSLAAANSSLNLFNQLQDFNKLDPSAFPVYPNFSPEETFHAGVLGYKTNAFTIEIDSNLYKTFNDPNDLRLAIYFFNDSGKIEFNSQFDFNNNTSYTISTDEVYLNKAECEARLNSVAAAINDLNTLLKTRWKTGTFKPYSATNPDNALSQILKERRKELVFTGLRWSDLRRLNKDPKFAITLYRNINGVTYSIPPNDPRYALPIPDTELQLNPMPQNDR